jgi:hypothetical protein
MELLCHLVNPEHLEVSEDLTLVAEAEAELTIKQQEELAVEELLLFVINEYQN